VSIGGGGGRQASFWRTLVGGLYVTAAAAAAGRNKILAKATLERSDLSYDVRDCRRLLLAVLRSGRNILLDI